MSTKPRKRTIKHQWLRDPNGPPLMKPGPRGTRTPNRMMWAHSLDEFAWIQRIPGVDVLTVWTRSMLKELGENYSDSYFAEDEVKPRLRRPWPVLRLPRKGNWARRYPLLSAVDEGSDHEDNGTIRFREDEDDDSDDEDERIDGPDYVAALPYDKKYLMANDPNNPVLTSVGHPYLMVWIPEIREHFRLQRATSPSTTEPVIPLDLTEVESVVRFFDEIGIMEALITGEMVGDDGLGRFVLAPPPSRLTTCLPDSAKKDDDDHNAASTSTNAKQDVAATPEGHPSDSSAEANDSKSSGSLPSVTIEKATEQEDVVMKSVEENIKDKGDGHETTKDKFMGQARNQVPTKSSPFFVGDLPKLEQFIPEDFFPDILLVHDPCDITAGAPKRDGTGAKSSKNPKRSSAEPKRYRRVFPKLTRDKGRRDEDEDEDDDKKKSVSLGKGSRTAHLHLHKANSLGSGNHSLVYRAPLTLPEPLSGRSRTGQVSVAAKTSNLPLEDRRLLQNEAEIYSMMPKHLMEEYCGYNLVTPMRYPVPVGAVVPKFYGYFVPVDDEGNSLDELEKHKNARSSYEAHWPSPILLLEECGQPIEAQKLTQDQKTECYSLMRRLHYEGFTQGSWYVRNLLRQPGPLSRPPKDRSWKTPSFRVIDFGRGESANRIMKGKELPQTQYNSSRSLQDLWYDIVTQEDKKAQEQLEIPNWDY